MLSEQMPFPCLYIAKVLDGPPIVTFSGHVSPLLIAYPEPSFPEGYNVSKLQTALVGLGKLLGSVVFTLRALPHIIRFKPDLFHVHTPLPIAPALVYKLLWRKPIVLTFHGTDYYRFRKSRALRWMIKKFVDQVICITPDMPDDFKTLVPEVPAVYVQNGVDLSLFRPDPAATRRKQIVTVGRLTWQKGYADLIRAMAQVVAVDPEYRLVIAGDGALKEELQAVAREAGIADNVVFAGMVLQPELVKILQESAVYVMASVSEGFPKALIEAMSCGLPVVVTDVGACGHVAKESGLVVPPADSAALADALLKMIADADLRAAYAAEALKAAQRYGWEKHTAEVQALYEQLLKAKEASGLSAPAAVESKR